MRFLKRAAWAAAVVVMTVLAGPRALAINTQHFTDLGESAFEAGTLHNVVVTNQGDVKLSRAVKNLARDNPDVTMVTSLAESADGTVYAGTGPKGILLSVKDGKVSQVAAVDGAVNILSLLVDDRGVVYMGTGGESGRVLCIDRPGGTPREIFHADGVQYIWALARTGDGNVYAATGPNGQVFEIHPDGSHAELYKSAENNILSMVSDGKDLLYLGTDPDGLVIRLNRKTKNAFVMYNAAESEITALALDSGGNLYAATGEADEREQQSGENAGKDHGGRPEEGKGGAPIPTSPLPSPPKPPTHAPPSPGQPKPIPDQPGSENWTPGGVMPSGMIGASLVSEEEPSGTDGPPASGPSGDGSADTSGANGNAGGGNANGSNGGGGGPAAQNAIYQIDKEGFVTEIFRKNAVIYSMILQGDVLLVGTGGEGEIYQVNPSAEETAVLAKVDVKQVAAMLAVKDGSVVLGLANTGGISVMSGGYATQGTFISAVLDATQVSKFGNMHFRGELPDGTTLTVATRSGNVKDADAAGWSDWTSEVSASETPVGSAPARFLQYRLTFGSRDSSKTAVVNLVDVAYQIPNMAPEIHAIKIESAAAGGQQQQQPQQRDAKREAGTGTLTISWDASDPNDDDLMYSLYFRMEGTADWILLKDKLADATLDWDTHTVADGRYQIKVEASDALSNPPGEGKTAERISDWVMVDNTPPVLGDLTVAVVKGGATITLHAQDGVSILASADFTVDSADAWHSAFPPSGMFDSRDEKIVVTLSGLDAGPHQVTIRVTDSHGNQALLATTVTITQK